MLPTQSRPVIRKMNVAAMADGNAVNPSWSFGGILKGIGNAIGGVINRVDPLCAIECAGALATCGFNPVCLAQKGMSKCAKCIK